MAFDGILIGFIVGFLRRGSLKGFANVKLRYGWMFPLLLGVQIFTYLFQTSYTWVAAISGYTFMSVYVLGLLFLWLNRAEKGFPILMIGVFLNFLVMLVNGGRMPVSIEAASVLDSSYAESLQNGVMYGKHTMLTPNTHLAFLGDIIPLTKPYYKQQVISIGDVISGLGIFLYIQSVMLIDRPAKTNLSAVEEA